MAYRSQAVLADPSHLLRIARSAQWELAGADLTRDLAAWGSLRARQRAEIADLVASFAVAESAVAAHLAPFVPLAPTPEVASLLDLQAGDEARHAALFALLAERLCGPGAVRPAVRELFEVALPAVASGLVAGTAALADGVALYHLVLEGLVFSVGQEALLARLRTAGLAASAELVERVQRDERWHVGLGVRLLADLGGAPPPADAVVDLALAAWGPADATPERLAHVLRVHGRRLREAGAAVAR